MAARLPTTIMNWNALNTASQLDALVEESRQRPVMIFKHSTRCSISATALNRMERDWKDGQIKPYMLDLLNYREVSNAVADRFGIQHESPQVLLLKDGRVVYHTSHMAISFRELEGVAA